MSLYTAHQLDFKANSTPVRRVNASPLRPWENNSDQAKAFFNRYVRSNVHKLPISIQDFELIKNERASDNYVESFDAWRSQLGHARDPPLNQVDERVILQEVAHLSNRILVRSLGVADKSILEMGAAIRVLEKLGRPSVLLFEPLAHGPTVVLGSPRVMDLPGWGTFRDEITGPLKRLADPSTPSTPPFKELPVSSGRDSKPAPTLVSSNRELTSSSPSTQASSALVSQRQPLPNSHRVLSPGGLSFQFPSPSSLAPASPTSAGRSIDTHGTNSGFVGSFDSLSLSSTTEPVNSSLPLNPEVANQGRISGIRHVCSSEGMTVEQKIEILVGGFQVSREAASLVIMLLSGASFL